MFYVFKVGQLTLDKVDIIPSNSLGLWGNRYFKETLCLPS